MNPERKKPPSFCFSFLVQLSLCQLILYNRVKVMASTAFILLATAGVSLASYHGNLNYRSPSLSHDGLGIDLPKVVGRMLHKRDVEYETDNLNFTHGVASV